MAIRLQRQLQWFLVDRQHSFVHCPSFRSSSVSLSFNPNSLHVDWIETKPRNSQHHWRQLVKWWCKELRRSAIQVPRSQLLKRTASFEWFFESLHFGEANWCIMLTIPKQAEKGIALRTLNSPGPRRSFFICLSLFSASPHNIQSWDACFSRPCTQSSF